jgi:hypothetical protein
MLYYPVLSVTTNYCSIHLSILKDFKPSKDQNGYLTNILRGTSAPISLKYELMNQNAFNNHGVIVIYE